MVSALADQLEMSAESLRATARLTSTWGEAYRAVGSAVRPVAESGGVVWAGGRAALVIDAAAVLADSVGRARVAADDVGVVLHEWAWVAADTAGRVRLLEQQRDGLSAELRWADDPVRVEVLRAGLKRLGGQLDGCLVQWRGDAARFASRVRERADGLRVPAAAGRSGFGWSPGDVAVGLLVLDAVVGLPDRVLVARWEALSAEEQYRFVGAHPEVYARVSRARTDAAGLPPSPEWATAALLAYLRANGIAQTSERELTARADADAELAEILTVFEQSPGMWHDVTHHRAHGQPEVTVELVSWRLQYTAMLRALALPEVFDELDAADGVADGVVTASGLAAVARGGGAHAWIAAGVASTAQRSLLANAAGSTTSWEPAGDFDRRAVIHATVNSMALTADPAAAREFVMSLPVVAEHRVGVDAGLPIGAFTDNAVARLAGAALADAPTMMDQVLVVGFLPESSGGVRNALITSYYTAIAPEVNAWMNPDIADPTDLGAAGHAGATWFNHAPWATQTIGVVIRGEGLPLIGAGPIGPQLFADGNQWVFLNTMPRMLMLMDAFPPGVGATPEMIRDYFVQARLPFELDGEFPRLFGRGDRQLRLGFIDLLEAREATDPLERQQLLFRSDVAILSHEQAALQGYLERSINMLPGGLDSAIAAAYANPQLGDYAWQADLPMPSATAEQTVGNLVRGHDMLTTLNPTRDDPDHVLGVALHPLTGVEELGRVDSADPAVWHDNHGWEWQLSNGHYVNGRAGSPTPDAVSVPGPSSGIADDSGVLVGARVDHVEVYGDRMWMIINGFLQNHTNPTLITMAPTVLDPTSFTGAPDVILPDNAIATLTSMEDGG